MLKSFQPTPPRRRATVRSKLVRLLLPAPLLGLAAIMASAAITAAPAGCMCTEVACSDGLFITLHRADDSWPTGGYTFDLVADGQASTCTFVWDGILSPSGYPDVLATCDATGFSVSFNAKILETTQKDANGTTVSGTPIPGKFYVLVQIGLAAEKVSVVVSRDGTSLLKKSLEPDYSAARPNGPFCGPACDTASETITVP